MSAEAFLLLFLALAVLTIKPGPGMVAMVSRGISDGFLPAFMIALGIATCHLAYFPLAALGFSFSGPYAGTITLFLQLVGAAYILWMGVKAVRNINRDPWANRKKTGENSVLYENYCTGLAINISNPFVLLYYVGLIPSIMDFSNFGTVDIVLGTVATSVIIVSLLSLECALAAQLREVLRDFDMVRVINIISACAMLGIGLFIVGDVFGVWDLSFDIKGV